ncbi:MAG: hypothetical protein RIC35_12720 [Marinoscillum sp.]
MGRLNLVIILLAFILHSQMAIAQESRTAHVIFNQPKYIAGDTVFFCVRYWDSGMPIMGKQILVMDLVGGDGKSVNKIKFNVNDGIGSNQMVLPSDLKEGIYNVEFRSIADLGRVYVKAIAVVDEKVLINESRHVLGVEQKIKVDLRLNKSVFQTRELVKAQIYLNDMAGLPVRGGFTVSVVNAKVFGTDMTFTTTNAFGESEKSPKIVGNRLTRFGTAYYPGTKDPLPDSTQLLFYLQQSKMRYQVFTIHDGKFKLEMLDIKGTDELYYVGQLPGKERALVRQINIDWDDDTYTHAEAPNFRMGNEKDPYKEYSHRKRIIDKSYGFYTSDSSSYLHVDRKEIIDPVSADQSFQIQDYILFPTMGELINAVISPLFYGKSEGKEVVRVRYLQPTEATEDPLYLIDGVATMNTDFFLSIEPLDVISVKTVRDPHKLVRFGALGRNGIVIVHTKFGNHREPLNPDNLVQGLTQPVPLTSDLKQRGIPDFRSTIYWDPSVQVDDQGVGSFEFYTTDDVGKMTVLVEGMSSNGELFFITKRIEVRSQKD